MEYLNLLFFLSYRNSSTALSLLACQQLLWLPLDPLSYRSPLELFHLSLLAFVPLHITLSAAALALDVAGKWALLGRRKQGAYPWDQSSYCQRWQCYLVTDRRNVQ